MKVYISSEGIYNSVRTHILNTKDDLSDARKVSYNCPSGFAYANFVRGLSSDIYDGTRKLETINNALYKNDYNYREHSSSNVKTTRNLKNASLNSRKGL